MTYRPHPAAQAAAAAPDPITYGPTGVPCGCGKPAHSNLVPCQPDAADDDTPTGQKYPASIGVYCDRCGATVEHDYIVTDTMTRQQRFAVARRHLVANEGWQCDGTGDLCPRCLAKAAAEQHTCPDGEPCPPHDEPAEQAPPVLTDSVRQFLTFALDQAAEEMSLRDGFTADDEAALATLRRLAAPPTTPRTERDYWQAIADALNAANAAGMPVGIDLDGVLTDHNEHAVVWDFEAERWTLAGYDDDVEEQQPAPFTEGRAAFMQIGTTPALQGLRAELLIEGYPPLIGRYAGAGMRRADKHEHLLLIEPTLVFEHEQPAEPAPAREEQGR